MCTPGAGGGISRSLARSRIFESSAQSLNSVAIFPPSRILTAAAAPCGGHVFYDGSRGSNLKLLKIDILIDAYITKVREVTKARNFLGPLRKCTLFGFVTVSL